VWLEAPPTGWGEAGFAHRGRKRALLLDGVCCGLMFSLMMRVTQKLYSSTRQTFE
jgi:hypothetical protein